MGWHRCLRKLNLLKPGFPLGWFHNCFMSGGSLLSLGVERTVRQVFYPVNSEAALSVILASAVYSSKDNEKQNWFYLRNPSLFFSLQLQPRHEFQPRELARLWWGRGQYTLLHAQADQSRQREATTGCMDLR